MKTSRLHAAALASLTLVTPLCAQEAEPDQAAQLANPISSLISVPF